MNEQTTREAILALFQPSPEGELGPTDEPESQYRFGYNTALEDAVESVLPASRADAVSAPVAKELDGEQIYHAARGLYETEQASLKPRGPWPKFYSIGPHVQAQWIAKAALALQAPVSVLPVGANEDLKIKGPLGFVNEESLRDMLSGNAAQCKLSRMKAGKMTSPVYASCAAPVVVTDAEIHRMAFENFGIVAADDEIIDFARAILAKVGAA